MYLSLLNEEQKTMFFSLAYDIAMSDGDFSDKEQAIMDSYANEMGTQFELNKVNTDISSVINKLNSVCDNTVKKVIIFEVIGLAMSDLNYDVNERKIISDAVKKFGLDENFAYVCENKILEYLEFQKQLNQIILA